MRAKWRTIAEQMIELPKDSNDRKRGDYLQKVAPIETYDPDPHLAVVLQGIARLPFYYA
jgi:hypothetical protein